MLRRCCAQRAVLPLRGARITAPITLSRRHQSTPPPSDPSSSPLAVQHHFAASVGQAVGTLGRLVTFGLIGLVTTGVVVGTAFEAAHQWVEHVGLKPETDAESQKWEWDLDMEHWTGGASGGTDGALGLTGVHALRSAWQALNWGIGTPTSGASHGGLSSIDPALEHAQSFLAVAYNTALQKRVSESTQTDILRLLADVMERIGTNDALHEARAELEDVWARIQTPEYEHDRPRVALKLGDLNRRLNAPDAAMSWWARTLHIITGSPLAPPPPLPVLPSAPPSTPAAQRTLASLLVSLSAFHATSGHLREARATDLQALELLRAIPAPASFGSSTPPQALHSLYILHRSALLSIHLAEVNHGLRAKPEESLEWLARAAESSERVARVLTGVQLKNPISKAAKEEGTSDVVDLPKPPMDRPLLKTFEDSPSMRKPARSLLRDARRSAAESWHLMGLLQEKTNQTRALECYTRAMGWADADAEGQALGREWKALLGNYTRAKDRIAEKAAKPAA